MNYNDYNTRQAGGALPYFVGARVQRGHGLGGPTEFLLAGSGDTYLDLANSYLQAKVTSSYLQAKVTKGNGTPLNPDNAVAPVNTWLHWLFSQVDVYLNGTLVTPSTNTYPYRAYIEKLLSYGSEAKETQLTSQL